MKKIETFFNSSIIRQSPIVCATCFMKKITIIDAMQVKSHHLILDVNNFVSSSQQKLFLAIETRKTRVSASFLVNSLFISVSKSRKKLAKNR